VNAFLQMLRNLGAARLAVMALVAVGLIAFFVYLTTRIGGGSMTLLYNELSPQDGQAIARKLDQMQVSFQMNPEGSQILVPADQVGKIRMQLAQDGLPSGGSIGYEIFDNQQSFGTTTFMQNMNQLRALEGELGRTISALGPIKAARVHLVMPRRELFSREESPASASIFVKLRGGNQLSKEQISAIQHLVGAAVPQLKPNAISVVDDKGNLLARGGDDPNSAAGISATADEMRRGYELRTQRAIEDLVSRVVGYGKVRATVNADMDFDRITTNTDTFDPATQVLRSSQTSEETSTSNESQAAQAVTVANNLPGANQQPQQGGPASTNQQRKTEETNNYEISRTQRSHVKEGPQVKKLSVAVLIDGTYTQGAQGQEYQPRSAEEMQQIEQIVKGAAGFDEKRGDTVSVANMRFAQEISEALEAESKNTLFGLTSKDLMKIAELTVLGVIGVLVMLLVVRPLLSRMLSAVEQHAEQQRLEREKLLAEQTQQMQALPGPDGTSPLTGEPEPDTMIDMEQVEGRVRASSLRKIGEIVEKHPNEAVSIIRGWMYQET
jgi:flagellar M-ring protein FliF